MEQAVLSISNSEVSAIILENTKTLGGIYTIIRSSQRRVEVNMDSGAVETMMRQEILEYRLGSNSPNSKNFKTAGVDDFRPPDNFNF